MTLWNHTKETWGRFEFALPSHALAWSTPLGVPGRCGKRMHQLSTSGIRIRRTRIRRWHFTCCRVVQCEGVGWLHVVVRINDNFCGMRESNVTIRSEIWTTHIRSLGFQDIRECVTLRGVDIMEFRVHVVGGCHLMIDVPCFSNFHDIIHQYGSSPLVLRILENYSPLILGPTWVLFTLRGWQDMWGFFKSLDLVLKRTFRASF